MSAFQNYCGILIFGIIMLCSKVENVLSSLKIMYGKSLSCIIISTFFCFQDGGVFTCGAGMYGQLGHGSTSCEFLPRKVLELMGSVVTQISCGR